MQARDQRTVYGDRLSDVVCMVVHKVVIHAKSGGAAVEYLPEEDATECAVVFLSDG